MKTVFLCVILGLGACTKAVIPSDELVPTFSGTVAVASGEAPTLEDRIALRLNAAPAVSMLVSNTPDCSAGTWEDYVPQKFWDLPGMGGDVIISARFKDALGGFSNCATAAIKYFAPPSFVAPFYLFQPNATSGGMSPVAHNRVGTNWGLGVFVDPSAANQIKFFQVDRANSRVLIFNSVPTTTTAVADVVVGQDDFISDGSNSTAHGPGANAYGFAGTIGAAACENGRFYIADRGNNRVAGYHQVPTANGLAADFFVGQLNASGTGAATTADGLNLPYLVTCKKNILYVVDRNNHRVMVYDPAPSTSGASATRVLGQSSFGSGGSGCSSTQLNMPNGLSVTQTGQIIIGDRGNNRVVVYDTFPTADGQAFDHVIGQSDFVSCSANGGSSLSAQTLNGPTSVDASGDVLAVSDYGNARLLFYRLPIATSRPAAFSMLGAADFVTTGTQNPISQTSLFRPYGVSFIPGGLIISDTDNHRTVGVPRPW